MLASVRITIINTNKMLRKELTPFSSLQLVAYYHVVCVTIDGVWIDD
jgi:hypothetical protein